MIIVIGKNGLLGSELCSTLYKKNIAYKGFDLPEIDVSKIDTLEKIITEEVSIIFNCSAFVNLDGAENDPEKAYLINALGCKNIAILAEKVGAKVIHISTDYVFDGLKEGAYCEYDIPNPLSVYGKTKFQGEQYIRHFCSRYFILRTAWLFSETGPNFIDKMIELQNSPELKVVNDQHGTPTSSTELVELMLKISNSENYGTFHASGEGVTTWYKYAKYIFEYLELDVNLLPCTSEEINNGKLRPSNSQLENLALKSEKIFNFSNWQDAVAKYLDTKKKG